MFISSSVGADARPIDSVETVAEITSPKTSRPVPKEKDEAKEVRRSDSIEISKVDGEKLAETLDKAIDAIHGNEIRFRVEARTEGNRAVSFAIVDKETGKVVREFPPERLAHVAEATNLGDMPGFLVDEPA